MVAFFSAALYTAAVKCIIDAREAYNPQKTGKGQWTKGFLNELLTRDVEVLQLTQSSQNVEDSVYFPSGAFWHASAMRFVKSAQPDFYISPTSYVVPFLLKQTVPVLPIVHDLIAFRGEPHDRKAQWIEKLLLRSIVCSAAHICTVSNTTKNDLIDQFSSPSSSITPIYAGPMQSNVDRNIPDGKTILCAGTLCPRKNQLRLIQAYALLPKKFRSQYTLTLVGSRGWHDEEVVRLAERTDGVVWKQYVPDDEYQTLLSTATIFAYPSLYEGFGMQVLDALQRGIPVLTSERGSLAEVVGDCAVFVDPLREKSIASGLEQLLNNEVLRTKLAIQGPRQAERFSWKTTVDLFLDAVEKSVYTA